MRGAAECQVLFELFASPRGKVWLGRMAMGSDAGRIVMLRETSDAARPELSAAVEAAVHLAHPKLLKVLGLVSHQSRSYIASEYIPGVSLFEVIAAVRKQQRAMMAGAAVRVISDALKLVQRGRAMLDAAHRPPVRLFNADCIWITDYGETLLSEAGVSAHLVASASATRDAGTDSESQDIRAAAVELYHLASGRLMTGDMSKNAKMHLSAPLAKVLDGVFSWDPTSGFDSAEALAAALSAMPPVLFGSEATVAEELRRLVADVMDERRRKLALLRGSAGLPDPEGATRVYGPVPGASDDTDEEEEEDTLAFNRVAHGAAMRPAQRVVEVEKPIGPETPAPHRPSPAPKLGGVFPERPSGGFPADKKWQPPPELQVARLPVGAESARAAAGIAQHVRAVRARLRHRFRLQRVLLERVLLVVLVLLIVIASALVLAQPSRLRVLVEHVKSLH